MIVWTKTLRICLAGFIFVCEYTDADGWVDGWADGELLNKGGEFCFNIAMGNLTWRPDKRDIYHNIHFTII